jgi:chromosome partitioning protein
MAVVAVFNQKGGVGKTTTALNVLAYLSGEGRRPYGVDFDPQGHLTLALGLRNVARDESLFSFFSEKKRLPELVRTSTSGLRLLPASVDLSKIDSLYGSNAAITTRLRDGVRELLAQERAPVIIDCSPMLGVLTLNALVAADRVLIPVSADFLSLQGVHRLTSALDVLEKRLNKTFVRRVVITRFSARRKLSTEIVHRLNAHFAGQVCATRISENVSLAESPMYGKDIFAHAPNSQGAQDYLLLCQELQAGRFFAD